jgi:hypothetical protein
MDLYSIKLDMSGHYSVVAQQFGGTATRCRITFTTRARAERWIATRVQLDRDALARGNVHSATKRIPRPRATIALAKPKGGISTGQINAVLHGKDAAAASVGGRTAGAKPAAKLTPVQRSKMARIATKARLKKS